MHERTTNASIQGRNATIFAAIFADKFRGILKYFYKNIFFVINKNLHIVQSNFISTNRFNPSRAKKQ